MSVRVTRKVRRVLDHLAARGPGTLHEVAAATNINWPVLQPILFKLEDEGWVTVSDGHKWAITPVGRAGRDDAAASVHRPPEPPRPEVRPRPRGPRPPYKQRFNHQ